MTKFELFEIVEKALQRDRREWRQRMKDQGYDWKETKNLPQYKEFGDKLNEAADLLEIEW